MLNRVRARRLDDLNLWSRKVPFNAFGRVGFYLDVARLRRGFAVLAEVESSHGNHPIADPARGLLTTGSCNALGGERRLFPGRNQSPALWIAELQVEGSHFQSAIRIPGSSGAYIKQSSSRFSQNLSTVSKCQLEFLSCLQKRRHDHGHNIIAAPGQLRTLQRRVMNE